MKTASVACRIVLLLAAGTCGGAAADEPSRQSVEDEMFGGTTVEIKEKRSVETLSWGGQLFLESALELPTRTGVRKGELAAPISLMLFADSQPNPKTRAFIRVRGQSDLTQNRLRGAEDIKMSWDEIWIKREAGAAFITVGRQPLRWGTGRFWNPTDFLSSTARDPFAPEDRRRGISVVKVHVPWERKGANFYALAQADGASTLQDLRGAARMEWSLPQAEASLTLSGKRKGEQMAGADLSAGLGDFDLRVEAATRGTEQKNSWSTRCVASAEYSFSYGDNDSAILGLEGYYNEKGALHRRDYRKLFISGQAVPMSLARHYAALWVYFPRPYSWNDLNVTLTHLRNLDDRSSLLRSDVEWSLEAGTALGLFGEWSDGPRNSEFFAERPQASNTEPVRATLGARLSASF